MTDMAELKKRKQPLNLAIVHVDPDAFIANLAGWLEITAFITAHRAGEVQVPANGITPALTAEHLKNGNVHKVGNDALFAFCMTAALKGDKAAVDKVEAALVESMGKEFPGAHGLWHFRGDIDAPVTLDDFVGQAGKKMLLGDIPPPPMRAKTRSRHKPLSLLIESVDQAEELAKKLPEEFYALARKFWPGPLTVIVKAGSRLPLKVTANTGNVALRVPNAKIPLAVVTAAAIPITATSANLSGAAECTTAEQVHDQLHGRISIIVDGWTSSPRYSFHHHRSFRRETRWKSFVKGHPQEEISKFFAG